MTTPCQTAKPTITRATTNKINDYRNANPPNIAPNTIGVAPFSSPLSLQILDHQLIATNAQLASNQALDVELPVGNSRGRVSEFTEMGLIRHEIGKQRRHCTIRDLLERAGNAVRALKPCFMMSPLSVAQYLSSGEAMAFDLVLMDEASQIKPEDALGTIIRAKQLVVVGDPKQLPPTSFFDRFQEDVDDDDATQFDNTESILEVAIKAFHQLAGCDGIIEASMKI